MKISPINNNYIPHTNFKGIIPNKEQSVFERYNINPDEIEVVASSEDITVSNAQKQVLIKKILEAHDLARKNYHYGNITNRAFATNLCLTDGSWHLGTNFNNTRGELSSICGERTALLKAYNNFLIRQPDQSDEREDLKFKVKYLAMSSHKPLGEDRDAACPCAECLSWFDAPRYFDDDTVLATLQKNGKDKLSLVLTKLSEYLPQRGENADSPKGPITKLPINISENAQDAMAKKDISEDDIKHQVIVTSGKYDSNSFAETSGQNITASVGVNNHLYCGKKIDFTKRWYIEPLEYAAAKAIEYNGEGTHINTICYIGDEIKEPTSKISSDRVVNIKVLGELTSKYADKDTLVITTKGDKIDVKTIGDYMPDKFMFKQGYRIQ